MKEDTILAIKQNIILIPFLSHILKQIGVQYGGFWSYSLLYYVLVLWLADFVSGFFCAVMDTWLVKVKKLKIEKPNILSVTKMARSVSKFFLLLVVVLTTFTMKKNGLVLSVFGSLVESLVLITQSASIFRNCGKVSKMNFLKTSAEYLEELSDKKLNEMKNEVHKNGSREEPA